MTTCTPIPTAWLSRATLSLLEVYAALERDPASPWAEREAVRAQLKDAMDADVWAHMSPQAQQLELELAA